MPLPSHGGRMENKMENKQIMLGNEAIARGAYEAGVKLSSAYPGTPGPISSLMP